jgi:hypothetical protein
MHSRAAVHLIREDRMMRISKDTLKAMCARYQRHSDKQKIAEAFQLGNIDGLCPELAPATVFAPGIRFTERVSTY